MGTKRYIQVECACSPDGCLHLIVGFDGDDRVAKCDKCGSLNKKPTPERTNNIKRRTWPYYNGSVGMTFESESHEQKVVKERNLTPYGESFD